MDQESLVTVIKILSVAFIAAGATLITLVTWVIAKTFNQNEDIKKSMIQEFQKFGQQLSNVRELLKDDIHKLSERMIAIEEWRKATEATKRGAD